MGLIKVKCVSGRTSPRQLQFEKSHLSFVALLLIAPEVSNVCHLRSNWPTSCSLNIKADSLAKPPASISHQGHSHFAPVVSWNASFSSSSPRLTHLRQSRWNGIFGRPTTTPSFALTTPDSHFPVSWSHH